MSQNLGYLGIVVVALDPCIAKVTHTETDAVPVPAADSANRQEEYKRAKDLCDSPPPPGTSRCSTISNQIEHARKCIDLYRQWDEKWSPGRHDEKIEGWENRLRQPQRRTSTKLHSKMKLNERLSALIARYQNHPEFLGISITYVDQPGAVDDTLLHIAARRGNFEDVDLLLQCGGSANTRGDLGYTPLHAAALGGHLNIIQKLLDHGADPFAQNELGERPADVARQLGHVSAAALLEQRTRL